MVKNGYFEFDPILIEVITTVTDHDSQIEIQSFQSYD